MALKRDALDAIFSDVVRESCDWVCQRCQKQFPDRKGQDAHCSHFFSRKFNSTRWHVDNATLLCAPCHAIVTDDPHEHSNLIRGILGTVRYQWLIERKQKIVRYRDADKKAMRKHFAGELARLLELRRGGATGYLEIYAYD